MIDAKSILTGKASKNTIDNYAMSWSMYRQYCGSEKDALKPNNLVEWREYLINVRLSSASTINNRMAGVKRVIKEASALGKIPRGLYIQFSRVETLPSNSLPERKRKNNRTLITPEQMRIMIDATRVNLKDPLLSRDRAVLLTLATSGMRSSEVCGVKIKDVIDLGGGCAIDNVTVKGGGTRRVPISRECYEAIKDWLFMRPINSEWVFTTERIHNPFINASETYLLWSDEPLTRDNIYYIVKKYASLAGVENVKTHDFRRFVGTTLARDNIRVAQQVLGHKSIATTAAHYLLDEVEPGATEGMF